MIDLSSRWILTDAQFCHGGRPTYQAALGPNPADPYLWRDGDSDSDFAQEPPISGQFFQWWKLRTMAREAASEGIAEKKMRRLIARNTSLDCADVKAGGSVSFHQLVARKTVPKWRAPAAKSDIDGTGNAAKFQRRAFKVSRAGKS